MERHGTPLSNDPRVARPLRVGLLGCGTVGTEVARLLSDPGIPGLELRRVAVRTLDKPRAVDLPPGTLTGDALAVVKDPDIDIVVELIGGVDPTLSLMRQALAEGKHVVTANKVLIAHHGHVLTTAADGKSLALRYEGAAGGAVPIVRTLRSLSSADHVRSLSGVLNGTTNFILSKMERGVSLDAAVTQAQAAGYAEADPSADLDGVDAACKLSLLCTLAFGENVPVDRILHRGIRGLSIDEVRSAPSRGLRFKMVATAERRPGGTIRARVGPIALDRNHPLARLEGPENGIVLDTRCSGEVSLFGCGAGGLPTAAAVVADLEDIALTALTHTPSTGDTHPTFERRAV